MLLSACGDVSIKPEAVLPKPLIVPIPADVGLIIPADTRKYVDQETRFGIDWKVDLGPGEVRLMQDVFKDLFQHVQEFKDLEAARAARDLKALFETRVDQYSFVTARETEGPLLRGDDSLSHQPVHAAGRESRQLHAHRLRQLPCPGHVRRQAADAGNRGCNARRRGEIPGAVSGAARRAAARPERGGRCGQTRDLGGRGADRSRPDR